MAGGNDLRGAKHVLFLVIKENVRAQRLQYWCFRTSPHEVCFVGWRIQRAVGEGCLLSGFFGLLTEPVCVVMGHAPTMT